MGRFSGFDLVVLDPVWAWIRGGRKNFSSFAERVFSLSEKSHHRTLFSMIFQVYLTA